MTDSKTPVRTRAKDRYPSGNVNEYHLWKCNRCGFAWRGDRCTFEVVRRPASCPKCFSWSVRPLGVLHAER